VQGRKIITIISAVLCVSMVISFLLVGCSNGLSSQTTGKEAASETTGKEAAPETTATSGQSIPTPQWSPGSSTEFKKQIQDYLAANKLTTVKIGFCGGSKVFLQSKYFVASAYAILIVVID